MAFFNSQKFEKDSNTSPAYVRASDAYAEKRGAYISFQHVPSKTSVSFKAFITTFNETYSSDWAPEMVYGRVDPIYLFKNTTRKISLAFKIPAESASEAFENLGRVQKLIQFLYPNYTTLRDPAGTQAAQTISQSPMVRIRVMNLLGTIIHSGPINSTVGNFADHNDPVDGTPRALDVDEGQLGVIDNLVVNHNLEGPDGVINNAEGVVLPKMIDINIGFSPIHEHPIGWSDRKVTEMEGGGTITRASAPLSEYFPYSINNAYPVGELPIASTQAPADQNELMMSGDGTESLDAGTDAAASPQGTQPTAPELSDAQKQSAYSKLAMAAAGITKGSVSVDPHWRGASAYSTVMHQGAAEAGLPTWADPQQAPAWESGPSGWWKRRD